MLKLRDIMTTDVVTVLPDTSLREAAALFARRHVSGAPVLREGAIVGVVSTSDIIAYAASRRGDAGEPSGGWWWTDGGSADETRPPPRTRAVDPDAELLALTGEEVRGQRARTTHGDLLDETTVEQVMTRKLWALDPEADVAFAAQVMARNGIHRVMVASNGRLAGVVSTTDITRAVADGRTG